MMEAYIGMWLMEGRGMVRPLNGCISCLKRTKGWKLRPRKYFKVTVGEDLVCWRRKGGR